MKWMLLPLSYLLGAFPTGYLFFKRASRQDIRKFGSGATGATNVLRLKGWRLAVPVVVIDVIKGALPAFAAWRITQDPGFAAWCASAAVVGHCFPVFIGFKGGKGVATAAGAMLFLAPVPALLCVGVFVLVVAATRFISLGSMSAAALFPVFGWLFQRPVPLILGSLPFIALILFQHRANIVRLVKGTERKIGEKASLT